MRLAAPGARAAIRNSYVRGQKHRRHPEPPAEKRASRQWRLTEEAVPLTENETPDAVCMVGASPCGLSGQGALYRQLPQRWRPSRRQRSASTASIRVGKGESGEEVVKHRGLSQVVGRT